jgi:hypothetical protein
VLFSFKCGLASEAGLRHLSWNNSGGSTTINAKGENLLAQSKRTAPPLILKFLKTKGINYSTCFTKGKKSFQLQNPT